MATELKLTTITAGNDFATEVVIQDDGKIVTGGYSRIRSLLSRVTTCGRQTSTPTFGGGDGIVTTDVPAGRRRSPRRFGDSGPDGKILAGGHSGGDYVVVRYLNDGTLDTSFGGGDGVANATVGANAWANDLTLQADGKILIAGYDDGATAKDFALVRFNANGTLDTTFGGGNGYLLTDLGGDDRGSSVVVQDDGRIAHVGWSDAAGTDDFAVVRYKADGTLDETFGSTNTLGDFSPTYIEGGKAIVLDSDVEVRDAELDALNSGTGNYNGASLTIARSGGANVEDLLGFNDGNGISILGSNLIKNSQIIATFDITSTSGELVITFTDAGGEILTSVDVDNILRQITYANSSDTPPSSVQLDWTFDDGNGGAQGVGGALQALGSTTVLIQDVADLAITAPVTSATPEDTAIVYSGANVIQVDDGLATNSRLRVEFSVANGILTLSGTTGLTFVEGADGSGTMVIEGLGK